VSGSNSLRFVPRVAASRDCAVRISRFTEGFENPGEISVDVEAHLLDFEGDLYGEELSLTFVGKLRDEKPFDSLEGLKVQIEKDIV